MLMELAGEVQLMGMVVLPVMGVALLMSIGRATAAGSAHLFDLQFADPQFLAGNDGEAEAAADGTGIKVGREGGFGAATAASASGNDLDDERGPLQESVTAAGFKAELHGIGNDAGEFADLHGNGENLPSAGVLFAEFHHTLGYG